MRMKETIPANEIEITRDEDGRCVGVALNGTKLDAQLITVSDVANPSGPSSVTIAFWARVKEARK